MPTSGVIVPKPDSTTPTRAASAVSRDVAAIVRPIPAGIPGRSARSDVTTKRASSMPRPRNFAGPLAARGAAAAKESAAQARYRARPAWTGRSRGRRRSRARPSSHARNASANTASLQRAFSWIQGNGTSAAHGMSPSVAR